MLYNSTSLGLNMHLYTHTWFTVLSDGRGKATEQLYWNVEKITKK